MQKFDKYGVFQIAGDMLFNVYREGIKVGDQFYANAPKGRVFCTVEAIDNFYTLYKKYHAINLNSAKEFIKINKPKWVKSHMNGMVISIGNSLILCLNHKPYISHPDNPYPDFEKEKFLLV